MSVVDEEPFRHRGHAIRKLVTGILFLSGRLGLGRAAQAPVPRTFSLNDVRERMLEGYPLAKIDRRAAFRITVRPTQRRYLPTVTKVGSTTSATARPTGLTRWYLTIAASRPARRTPISRYAKQGLSALPLQSPEIGIALTALGPVLHNNYRPVGWQTASRQGIS